MDKQKEEFDKIFEIGGIKFSTKGRYTIVENNQTKEEYQESLNNIISKIPETEQELSNIVDELEFKLLKYNPFEVIALLALFNSLVDPETYKEPESETFQAYIEYVSSFCLIHPFEDYECKEILDDPLDFTLNIQSKIKDIFSKSSFLQSIMRFKNQAEIDDYFQYLRQSTLSYELIVRNNEYLHHLIETLDALFIPQEHLLEEGLGFKYSEAKRIFDGIKILFEEKFNCRREEVSQEAKNLLVAARNFRKKRKMQETLKKYPRELLERLTQVKPSETKKIIASMCFRWSLSEISDDMVFTISELSKTLQMEHGKVQRIVDFFSIIFGDVSAEYYRYPSPSYPIQLNPIIHNSGIYCCSVFCNLYSSFRPKIETYLQKSNSALWNRYAKSRSSYLEIEALRLLNNTLQFGSSHHSLTYQVTDESGNLVNTELDGLIILDRSIFLIEAKSGKFSQPSKRGAIPSIKEDLSDLISDAQSQLIRAINYIEESEKPTFYLTDKTIVKIDKSHMDTIYPIIVTLDNLDVFITNSYRLVDIAILSDEINPWIIDINNLRIVTEMLSTSYEFVHYLSHRLHINKLEWVSAMDEIDLLVCYIKDNLYYDPLKESLENVKQYNILNHSWLLDDYYFYKTGAKKQPVEKPRQEVPTKLREILDSLESHHPEGYLFICCSLLDLSSDTREQFIKMVENSKRKSLQDGKEHNFTMEIDDGSLCITFFSSLEFHRDIPLSDRLKMHCILKKYQVKADNWIGLGSSLQEGSPISCAYVDLTPWEYDQKLEEVSNEYFLSHETTLK